MRKLLLMKEHQQKYEIIFWKGKINEWNESDEVFYYQLIEEKSSSCLCVPMINISTIAAPLL